jgi:hypothetical protein
MRCAAASSRRRERRFGTSLRALLLLAIGASFVVAAAPARAACPLTDPTCVIETVGQVVEPVTDPMVDQVDQVVDPVTEVTDPVTDPVTGTVGGVVDEVQDTVGQVVDVTEPSTAGDSSVGPEPRTGPEPGNSGDGRSDPGSGGVVERPIPVPALVGGTFIPNLESISDVRIGPSPPAERGGVGLEDVVKGLVAFPLTLALIVGALLLAQNRLDRRDHRLALAPVGPDVLDFT